jgi:hypothetical protein
LPILLCNADNYNRYNDSTQGDATSERRICQLVTYWQGYP